MSLDQVHTYIREKQTRLLGSLLSESPNLVAKADEDGRTPLMLALSESQDPEIVSEVLKAARSCPKFDIDAADNAGFTPLHIAASLGGHFVEQLLPFKPTIDSRTHNSQTPLFFAVSKKQVDAAKLLIENQASVRTKDKRQVTVLMRAVGVGSISLVRLILASHAPVNATDAYGWSALHYAYAEAREDAIRLLLQNGADPELRSRDEELPHDVAPRGFLTELQKKGPLINK